MLMPSGQQQKPFWATYEDDSGQQKPLSDADAFALRYGPTTTASSPSNPPLEQYQPTRIVRMIFHEPVPEPELPKETPFAPEEIKADLDRFVKLGKYRGKDCLWIATAHNKWHPIWIAPFRARIIQRLYDRREHVDERIIRVRDLTEALEKKNEESVWNALDEIAKLPGKKVIHKYSRGWYGLSSNLDCCKHL